MNINLSMEEIEIIREALSAHRSIASIKYSEMLNLDDDVQYKGDAVIVANQHRKAISSVMAKVEEEVGKHFSDYMVEQWRKANA